MSNNCYNKQLICFFLLIIFVSIQGQNDENKKCLRIKVECLDVEFDLDDYESQPDSPAEIIYRCVVANIQTIYEEANTNRIRISGHPKNGEVLIHISLPGHDGINTGCIINTLENQIILHVIKIDKFSLSETNFFLQMLSETEIRSCFEYNVTTVMYLEEVDESNYYNSAVKSESYIIKLWRLEGTHTSRSVEALRNNFGFIHSNFIIDGEPYIFIGDPSSRSKKNVDIMINHSGLKADYIRNIYFCLPETTSLSNGKILTWYRTEIYSAISPKELCLDYEEKPVKRFCKGNLLTGAIWSDPPNNCYNESPSKKFSKDNSHITNIYFCLPETTSLRNGKILTWDRTIINSAISPKELCLDSEEKPVKRFCTGNLLTDAIWSDPPNKCFNESPSKITKQNEIVEKERSSGQRRQSLWMLYSLTFLIVF